MCDWCMGEVALTPMDMILLIVGGSYGFGFRMCGLWHNLTVTVIILEAVNYFSEAFC